ncbi:hypothetical protein Tco_1399608 [Tanacetum coccineum]
MLQPSPLLSALIDVQLRVTNLEKDMSELKKIDHSAKALATLKHTVDLILKYSMKPAPESSKIQKPTIDLKQESKKSASNIVKIKREQAEKKNMPKYTIKSTDKAALKEYDQKSDLYQTMYENKYFNINHANHALYHALIEALIEDENAMDNGVADIVKNHKRQQDYDDDYDGEDPSVGPNQGSKTSKSASAKELVEEPIVEVVMDYAFNTTDWFKQPLRPPTLDLEWNKRQVVLDQAEQPGFNQMVSATKDHLTFNDLLATPIDLSMYVLNRLKIDNLSQDLLLGPAFNLLKGTCTSNIELKYNFQECHPGYLTVAADYFFNNDLEFLKTSDPEKTYTTSITKTKAARYEIKGIEDMVLTLWSTIKHAYNKDAKTGIKH